MIKYDVTIVLQGGLTSHFYGMGVMPMKNHFDFKDVMTFISLFGQPTLWAVVFCIYNIP